MPDRAPRRPASAGSLAVPILLALGACSPEGPASAPPAASAPEPGPAELAPWFEQVEDSGVDHRHFAGIAGHLLFPELFGSGGALIDVDLDGDLDLFAVQATRLDDAPDGELFVPPPDPPGDRLFLNETAGPEAPIRFVDGTLAAGVGREGYGMGAAVGDVDRDGWPDLYVTRYGSNTLWRNRGDGTFEDWTERSGAGDPRWSTGASFLDLDGDGDHDLWITNYVEYRPEIDPPCRSPSGRPDYCHPSTFPPAADRLLRNRGDGTFEDVSDLSGISERPSTGFGGVGLDADSDGRLDVYVSNDERPNHLWRNLGDGRFEEIALRAGLAVNADGVAEASMGLAVADLDGDGREDVLSTHLDQESHTLWIAGEGGFYSDRTRRWGLASPTTDVTGFGAVFEDFDGDGTLDLLVVHGAVRLLEGLAAAGDPFPFHQRDQLYRGTGDDRFSLLGPEESGAVSAPSTVSRGLATGDLDGDGDRDAVVFDNSGPVRILRNRLGHRRPWIGLKVAERLPDGRLRDALGAVVAVERPGAPTLRRRVRTDGSYLVAHDPRLQIGLGDFPEVAGVEVVWPDGNRERWGPLEPGRYHDLVRGESGAAAESST